ncbi:Uncharacterized protein JG29_07570 [Bombilactobacillus mellis]|uniref:Cell cycle protein GpsB n=1 Tax=Bombilactobacillus mellis TaxID=1218508 RepID=A0A0F4KQL8_9LACO|nr:cell division regulator GpsB [Bombilactobacillus mellis]MBI0107829.1 cell division regulator GpsB [Lactobacillus sp. W8086]MBI0109295.1 cell division regulator GpsB [Lactobacillus sp. W8085]MBI0112320.1 cell division regulator GpsB [Lactobacillus sp. W8088]MBI0116227.1 cell division regulator GpsB [Lactobacillus sp. W8087]MBI0119761.1 cell division regulator GpsB [Lactobacillus sp. W8089]MBI0131726.1 cell division regulator GpsB [Lactobacillus sp. W8090]
MAEVKLDPKQIVEKRFRTTIKGYNAKEVDSFLDEIIQDYEAYTKIIADLKSENKRLIEQIDNNSGVHQSQSSDKPETNSKPVNTTMDNSAPGTTYYDILKRLSNLERHVFGQSASSESNNHYAHRQPIVNSSEQLSDN